jgi:ketosteroid isomerase-like protein
MTAEEIRTIIRDFFAANTRASRGERVDPLAFCHDDLTWTMTGSTPVARTYAGLETFRSTIGQALSKQFSTGPSFGLYPTEIIVEGNRAAVMARGQAESAYGTPYNNTYFFFIEIRDGKLFRVLESCDGALVMQSVFDTHLEKA